MISWRRTCQSTPVFFPEKSHGQRSLEIYSPWGCKRVVHTERLSMYNTHKSDSREEERRCALICWPLMGSQHHARHAPYFKSMIRFSLHKNLKTKAAKKELAYLVSVADMGAKEIQTLEHLAQNPMFWKLHCFTKPHWCFWTVVLEKTLESPLDCKEIKPVNPKGNHSWVTIGRTDAEAPILWPPDAKNLLIGKDPNAGKDWRQEEKGMTEDEMVGWHHQLNGHEFEWALGAGDGQGGLACCSPWGHRVEHRLSDWTEPKPQLLFYVH